MQFSQMTSTGAAGGEGESSGDALERWHRSHRQPDNEVPVAVALTAVLARTADLAVILTTVQAASTGFGFEVSVRMRQSPQPGQDVYGQFMANAGAGGQFLLGVEFCDGRRASVLDPLDGWAPTSGTSVEELPVTLSGAGGGGGGRRFDHTWWVSPLPPPGPLLVVVRWDAQDLPETVVELDGGAIAAAGAACQQLWPWEPERSDDFEQQQEALRPTSGWFSQGPGQR